MEGEKIREFLLKFFEGVEDRTEQVEIRAIQNNECKATFFIELMELDKNSNKWRKSISWLLKLNKNGAGIYFGVGTRKQGRKKENIISLPSFWVDIDYGEDRSNLFDTEEKARQYIEDCLKTFPEPSLFINSGYGFHLYWFLKSPYKISEENKIESINFFEDIENSIIELFYGDNVGDITRIMRIPETFNTKQKPFVRVKIEKANWDKRYDITDFVSYNIPKPHFTISKTQEIKEDEELLNLDEVREKIGEKYFNLIKKGWEAGREYKSRSEVDIAVIKALLKAGYTPEQIKSIFSKEPIGEKYREKGKWGDNYLVLTIKKARQYIENEEEKKFKSKTTAIIPYSLMGYYNTMEGKLTRKDIKEEGIIEAVKWVNTLFDISDFKQEDKVNCIFFEKDKGTYKITLAIDKTGENLFPENIKIDLTLMKEVFFGLFNEALNRHSYVFTIPFYGFIKKYWGDEVKPEKIYEALINLSNTHRYVAIKKDKKNILVESPGTFIGFKKINKGMLKILVNPLYTPDNWDILTGQGIKGYIRIPLPFSKEPKKNLEKYVMRAKEFVKDMLEKRERERNITILFIGAEKFFKRIEVKDYELKREQKLQEIWERIKRGLNEEGIECKVQYDDLKEKKKIKEALLIFKKSFPQAKR